MLSEKEKKVISLIEKDASYSNYFFNKVKDIKWFYPLQERGFFLPSQIPQAKDDNFLFWNVLDYLERVSEQVEDHNKYGKELLDIIETTVHYSNQSISESKTGINNYHIWWYFVKIINNLPPEIINENLPINNYKKNNKTHYGFRSWLLAMKNPYVMGNWEVNDISRKLLPKFLEDDYPAEYAETIIDVITRIKEGGSKSPFSGRKEVVLGWDAYWVLEAFQKNHEKIAGKCSKKAILNIADKLKDALLYKQQSYSIQVEKENHVYQIKVIRVPIQEQERQIAFEKNRFQCVVGQFTSAQLKSVDREKPPYALYNTDAEIMVKEFYFHADNKTSFASEIKGKLPGELKQDDEVKDLDEKINEFFEGLNADYCYISVKSLALGGSTHDSSADGVLIRILRDVLLSKCEVATTEGKEILENFLTSDYPFPTFRRFVLLCMDKFWNEYKGLLNNFIKVVPKALEESNYEVELFDLLKNHNQDFDDQFIERLKKIIDDGPRHYRERNEKMVAYWKFMWLTAVKDHTKFKDAYKEAKKKAEPKDDKDYEPDRDTIKGGFVTHASPLSMAEFLQKPIPEIVKFLKEFKGSDFWQVTYEGAPGREGLADTLQSAVKDNPRKFTDEFGLFGQTDQFYLVRIFRGLNDAWKEGKEIDWEKIFDFCLIYFGRDKEKILYEFKSAQGEDSRDERYIWLVDNIVDLIAEGSKDDKRAFSPDYFDKAEKIFSLVFPLLKGEKHPDTQRDAVTYALNTTLGRTVMAYVTFSLRVARGKEKKEPDWGKNKFERFFRIGIDPTIWFGSYLPQMNFLDESYTKEKIEHFSKKSLGDFEWKMFMEGYLHGGYLYEKIYHLMRENYKTAIESTVFEDRDDQRLVEHISFGYLYYGEDLDENNADGKPSLFRKMLNEAKSLNKQDRWLKVVGFFWSVSGRKRKKDNTEDALPEDAKKRILNFWQWTYDEQDFVKDNLGEKYFDFLGELSTLTVLLDRLEAKDLERLILCAPHVDRHHHSDFFIEYLTMFEDDKSVKSIGKIFLKILENSTPTFREEEIQLLVERIYKLARKNSDAELEVNANGICNTYGRRGVHFLKEMFNRYN